MWQAPNSRVRALANAKRREKERYKRSQRYKRVQGEIRTSGKLGTSKVSQARVILNDFNEKGVGVFSVDPLPVGEEVAITIEYPTRFFVKGRIVWCREVTVGSHILSQNSFSYRAGIQFSFSTEEEKQAVKAFCDELTSEHLTHVKAA